MSKLTNSYVIKSRIIQKGNKNFFLPLSKFLKYTQTKVYTNIVYINSAS